MSDEITHTIQKMQRAQLWLRDSDWIDYPLARRRVETLLARMGELHNEASEMERLALAVTSSSAIRLLAESAGTV